MMVETGWRRQTAEAKRGSGQKALLTGQLEDLLGLAAEQLDRRLPAEAFGGLQEPDGGSNWREGKLSENLFEAGDNPTRLGLELPLGIAPLRADPQGKEAPCPA